MTARLPARTGRDDLAHRLAVTLTGEDAVTVAMGLAHDASARDRHDALLALAAAEEDLHDDGLTTALHEAVAALTPGMPPARRDPLWQDVAEAVHLIPAWQSPGAADLFADIPPGADIAATVHQAVDRLEYRRDVALTQLVGGSR